MPTKSRSRSTRPASSGRARKRAPKANASASAVRGIKLRRLVVNNVKVLDKLVLDFPAPRMNADSDIIVLGSSNGLGKTSVLESCAMLFVAAALGEEPFERARDPDAPVDLPDLIVRAGAQKARIEGDFLVDGKKATVSLNLPRKGRARVTGDVAAIRAGLRGRPPWQYIPGTTAAGILFSVVGLYRDPLVLPPLMYFHSYRKVQEGRPDLATLAGNARPHGPPRQPAASAFKLDVIRSKMEQKELFEDVVADDAGGALVKLGELVERYAGGRIGKLRTYDNAVEIRIEPLDGGPSYSFDGLSSGQKEVISTLFLIWRYARGMPGIILIDEPELYLNAEWQVKLTRLLHRMAPSSQYIIATHSEDIAASVGPERRIMLEPEEE